MRGSAACICSGASIDIGNWIKTVKSCGSRCAQGSLDVAEAAIAAALGRLVGARFDCTSGWSDLRRRRERV